jgi:hypothetical protein
MAGGDIFSPDTKSDTGHAAPAGGAPDPRGVGPERLASPCVTPWIPPPGLEDLSAAGSACD